MKYFFSYSILVLLLSIHASFLPLKDSTIKICTWNIRDFGKSKSAEEIDFIANTIRTFDVVVVQEVVAGDGGAQAVARLADALNRKGSKWDYSISDPTISSSYKTERYAYLWKTSRVQRVGKPWLEHKYQLEIDREPFFSTFSMSKKEFTLVNFHAITKSKQPETEVKYFKFFPNLYPKLNLIYCGDFNLPQSHTVFNPIKGQGFVPALNGQKTSLRQQCKGEDCLASEFDNIFYNRNKVKFISAGIIPFYKKYPNLKEAALISDHVPVFFEFMLN